MAIPIPVKKTFCGLSGALSLIVSVPETVPGAEGVNPTVMLQLVPGPTEISAEHVVPGDTTSNPAEGVMLEIVSVPVPVFVRVRVWSELVVVSVPVPVFVRVRVWSELVVPCGWLGKESEPAERLTTGLPEGGAVTEKAEVRVALSRPPVTVTSLAPRPASTAIVTLAMICVEL
jgi:hypothetical protein